MKVILHLDMDSYFVSAARVVNPSLIGKKVAVGDHGKRSILSAVSYEAKKEGIYVPMPDHKALKLVSDLIIIKPDFNLYTKMSKQFFDIIQNEFTEKIEVGSIDECYIDGTDIWKKYGSPVKLAKAIQNRILEKTKLPCSIGIAENKFVAKMTSPLNKPFGISVTKPGDFLKTFGDFELNKFFGIGIATEEKLNSVGIMKIEDLANSELNLVKSVIGKKANDIIQKANGISNDEINLNQNNLKSISNSITFMDYDKSERWEILDVMKTLVRKVSHRAQMRNLIGTVVTISIKEKGPKTIKARSHQKKIAKGISSQKDIMKIVIKLFDELWNEKTLKFLSVGLSGLIDIFENNIQTSIFETTNNSDIENIVSNVNSIFGKKVVTTGKEMSENIKKQQKQSRYLERDRLIK